MKSFFATKAVNDALSLCSMLKSPMLIEELNYYLDLFPHHPQNLRKDTKLNTFDQGPYLHSYSSKHPQPTYQKVFQVINIFKLTIPYSNIV